MKIIVAVLLFGIIVLVHEFGHFYMARRNGVLVEEFAIGMGPIIFKTKPGETLYSIRLFPFGGFCKMLGEDEESSNPRSFNNVSVFGRMQILAAGITMNFLLAFVLFFIVSSAQGYSTTTIDDVIEGLPASEAGLQKGDEIVKINNKSTHTFEDISFIILTSDSGDMNIEFKRDGELKNVVLTPVLNDGRKILGFRSQQSKGFLTPEEKRFYEDGTEVEYKDVGFFDLIGSSFYKITFYIKVTFASIGMMINQTIGLDQLSGPVGIVVAIGDQYSESMKSSVLDTVLSMMSYLALLSANVGVFNLLPIPALDGGRLVFLCVEAIRGKPISPEVEGKIHLVGFALLISLALFVTFRDITSIFN